LIVQIPNLDPYKENIISNQNIFLVIKQADSTSKREIPIRFWRSSTPSLC